MSIKMEKWQWRLLFYSYLIISSLRHLVLPKDIVPWHASQWVLSYSDNGFISRAFAGTIMRMAFPQITYIHLYILFLFVFLLYLFVLAFMFENFLRSNNLWMLAIMMLYILMPISVGYYLSQPMFGRFDLILLLICGGSVFMIRKGSKFFLLLIPILSLVGLLIHDAYLFIYFPIILILLVERHNASSGIVRLFSVFVIFSSAVLVALYFWFVPREMTIAFPAYLDMLQRHAVGFNIEPDMVSMQYYWTLDQHFSFAFRRLFRMGTLVHVLIALPILLPLVFLMVALAKAVMRKRGALENKSKFSELLFLTPLCPLFLVFLGVDFWRWVAASINCMFIVSCILLHDRSSEVSLLFQENKKLSYYMLYLAVMSLALGIMNETTPFLWVNKYDFFKAWFGAA